ncbi:unnamed protein product [Trifolium pratense]|uniref:Uncharacterized protein n=1 Tax=Trifolium pratense TaxID=57577 RepID=A0ACB0KE07_TRIPR|nr:unnamed protein product [Trifolium pratense]
MVTPRQHIEDIRRTKFSIGGEPNLLTEDLHHAVKNLSSELYTKDVHFLMELIQNAEDNHYIEGESPTLEFVITSNDITATGAPATLLIFNNGKGFSPKNIDSVCGVGRSTKKGNRSSGYIGEKGIGFKSVFLVTAQPYIFSNGYQIRFNERPCPHCGIGYIVPEWVEEKPTLTDIKNIYGIGKDSLPTTTIVLPLKPEKVESVKQQLSSIHPEVLLFLNKMRHLSECSYYMWKQKFPVRLENMVETKKDVKEWVVTLAFPNQERLYRGKTLPGVYAFLPTEMVTNFPFIIQADFFLASSRETILWDNKWNQGILECVPSAFVDALKTFVAGSVQAPVSNLPYLFKFLPIDSSPFENFNQMRKKIKAKLHEENILPIETHTKQKQFFKPCEVRRLLHEFWNILTKANDEGVYFPDLSSHDGIKILSSSFDKKEYRDILKFLGVKLVNIDWYAKCIQSSNLVHEVSEDAYLKILMFVARHWFSMFKGSNIINIPLIKYVASDGIPEFAIAYAHFLYVALSMGYLSSLQVSSLCSFMPLVDNYGNITKSRKGVLLPANVSKWSDLIISNPWRNEGYVELGKAYLNASSYAGQNTSSMKVINFLETYVKASDIPYIYPPNAGFSAADTPLTKDNAFLLLDWIRNLRCKGTGLPMRFLECIRKGNWLKVTCSNGYMPPSESFLIGSSLIKYLQSSLVLVDIALIDESFYGDRIHEYKLELTMLGVKKFSYAEAFEFIERELMSRAASFSLQGSYVLSMLNFIQYLRKSQIPLDKFVDHIRVESWLRTSWGLRSPVGSVLNDSRWKVASQISNIPFIDNDYFGHEIYNYKEELKLLGVIVDLLGNHQVVIEHLKLPSNLSSLTDEAVLLMLECIKYSNAPTKLLNSLKGTNCLKTNIGFKTPDECFLYDPVWGCILKVFDGFSVIDHELYGEKIFSYKDELKQIGVLVDFKDAIKIFASLFEQKALETSINQQHVISFLSCCKQLKGTDYSFPSDFSIVLSKMKWLHTEVGGFRCPRNCILYGPEWKSISSITCLPFIDYNDRRFGMSIYKYKEELKRIGVVTELKDGARFLPECLSFPSNPSNITAKSVFSLLEWIRLLMQDHKPTIEDGDLKKRLSRSWLKTHAGYRPPDKCLFFNSKWGGGKWVDSHECVVHDPAKLFGSKFYVLEDIYDSDILLFLYVTMEVKNKPSLEDYVDLWNDWGSSMEQLSYDEYCRFWMSISKHLSTKQEKKFAESLMKLPATSGNNKIFLVDKEDVFIPDNFQMKKLFEREKVFVWYPQHNMTPCTKNISESLCKEESSLVNDDVKPKHVDPNNIFNLKGLVKLILGFLACSNLKMKPNKRHEVVQSLLNLSFHETMEPINVSYSLSLSSGDIITKKANKSVCWESQSSKFIIQNMDGDSLKYATSFSEAISEGVLCENHDYVPALSELITLGFFLKFKIEEIDFLMESKYLQIDHEDEKFLSSVFPSD